MKQIDPRLRNVLRELYGDTGVGDNDHDLAIAFLKQHEIAHVIGYGNLVVNGVPTPYSNNKLLRDGPSMLVRRVFNSASGGAPPYDVVPTLPDRIQIGIGTGAETLNSGLTQCQTPSSDPVLAVGAPTSIALTGSGGVYPWDTQTVSRAYGVLTGLVGTVNIAELALINTDGTPVGWGRVLLPAVVPVTATTDLTANYIVRASG
jgi:hypothetical protein